MSRIYIQTSGEASGHEWQRLPHLPQKEGSRASSEVGTPAPHTISFEVVK